MWIAIWKNILFSWPIALLRWWKCFGFLFIPMQINWWAKVCPRAEGSIDHVSGRWNGFPLILHIFLSVLHLKRYLPSPDFHSDVFLTGRWTRLCCPTDYCSCPFRIWCPWFCSIGCDRVGARPQKKPIEGRMGVIGVPLGAQLLQLLLHPSKLSSKELKAHPFVLSGWVMDLLSRKNVLIF